MRLVPVQPPGPPLEPRGDRATIGRVAPADIVVAEASVSRTHALLERHAGGWRITDQGSANGTYLDGARITSADLQEGQELSLGGRVFRIELDGHPPATAILPALPVSGPPRGRPVPPRPPVPRVSPGPAPAGLWREGPVLVLLKSASLPDRCVRCGEPSAMRLRRTMGWHHPALGLLILAGCLVYVIVAMVVRKTAVVEVPLCARHKSRRTILGLSGTAALLIGLAIVVGTLLADGHGAFVLLGLVLALGGLTAAGIGSRLVTPRKIDDHFVWIGGMHQGILAGLPPWPGPIAALTGMAGAPHA